MVTPVNVAYTVASGVTIRGGKAAPSNRISGDVAWLGDSLTDGGYPHGAFRLGMGLTMRPLRMVLNGGVYGNTIKQAADRLQAILDSLPNLKALHVRIGTNGAGSGTTTDIEYGRIFDMCEAAGVVTIMHAVPPYGSGATVSGFVAQNAWLKAQCDLKPALRRYVEDGTSIGDANYRCLAGMFLPDNIHMAGLGVATQAEQMATPLADIYSLTDPLITSANDRYSVDPVNGQYVTNPLMTSTAGGTPTNWVKEEYGVAAGTITTVAADAGEANQSPWMRVTYNTGGAASHALRAIANMEHPAVAADLSAIARFDMMVECRMNNLITDNVEYLSIAVLNSSGVTVSGDRHYMKSSGTRNDRFVFRCAGPRATPLVAASANSLKFRIQLSYTGAFSTSIGSIDFRRASVRGSIT